VAAEPENDRYVASLAPLTRVVSLIMHYPHPCCLWWGKDLTLIYNEAYSEVIDSTPHSTHADTRTDHPQAPGHFWHVRADGLVRSVRRVYHPVPH
jgi:hypothetical protein